MIACGRNNKLKFSETLLTPVHCWSCVHVDAEGEIFYVENHDYIVMPDNSYLGCHRFRKKLTIDYPNCEKYIPENRLLFKIYILHSEKLLELGLMI